MDGATLRGRAVRRGTLPPYVAGDLEGVGGLREALFADGSKGIGRSFDDRAMQADVRGRVGRDGRQPAFAETNLSDVHESCVPEHDAVEAKRYVRAGCADLRVQFSRQVIEEVLSPVPGAVRRRGGAQIDAVGLTQDLPQRALPDDGREGARHRCGPVHLAADDQPARRRAAPPQGLARASQVESVGRLWSSCAPKQTEFQWTRTVGGPGDGYRFRERHAVRDLLVRPQIVTRWSHLRPVGRR